MKRIAVMMAACGLAASGGAFERIAQADHWDFSGHFDVETEDGIRAIARSSTTSSSRARTRSPGA